MATRYKRGVIYYAKIKLADSISLVQVKLRQLNSPQGIKVVLLLKFIFSVREVCYFFSLKSQSLALRRVCDKSII